MVHAEAIRLLAKRAASDIVEIGERLNAVRGRIGHGDWLPWLDREFSWSEQSARRFVQVAKAFKSLTASDLEIDATALYQRSARVVSGNVMTSLQLSPGPRSPCGARFTDLAART